MLKHCLIQTKDNTNIIELNNENSTLTIVDSNPGVKHYLSEEGTDSRRYQISDKDSGVQVNGGLIGSCIKIRI